MTGNKPLKTYMRLSILKYPSLIISWLILVLGFLLPIKIPIIETKTSHAVLKGITLLSLPLLFSLVIFRKEFKLLAKNFVSIYLWPLYYLLSLSISGIFSQYPKESFRTIPYYTAGIIAFYFLSWISFSEELAWLWRKTLYTLGIVAISLSLMVAIIPQFTHWLISIILTEEFYQSIRYEYFGNEKIFPLGPIWLLTPLYFYFLVKSFNSHRKKILSKPLIFFVLLQIAVLLTNWRILVLGSILAVFVYIRLNPYVLKKSLASLVLWIILIIIFFTIMLTLRFNQNIFKRFLKPTPNDIKTILARPKLFKEGLEIFLEHPIFGIGMGAYNYISENSIVKLKTVDSTGITRLESFSTYTGSAHNIIVSSLAEVGLVGTVPLLSMIGAFLFYDYLLLKNTNLNKHARLRVTTYMVSSWTFLLANLTENVLFYNSFILFMTFRALICSEKTSGAVNC